MEQTGIFSSNAPMEDMTSLGKQMTTLLDEAWDNVEVGRVNRKDELLYQQWPEWRQKGLESLAAIATDLAAKTYQTHGGGLDDTVKRGELARVLASCLGDGEGLFEHIFVYFSPTPEKMESLEASWNADGQPLASELERLVYAAE